MVIAYSRSNIYGMKVAVLYYGAFIYLIFWKRFRHKEGYKLNTNHSSSYSLATIIAVFLFSFGQLALAEGPELGGSCTDSGSIYHLTQDIQKSLWKLEGLYAVPVGTRNPESWDQHLQFNTQFISQLQSGETARAFAEACVTVWQNFFNETADILVTASRTITVTDQVLQCVSGTWVSDSTQYLEFQDVSDWQSLTGSPFDVTDPLSESEIESDLQALVDSLNAQPGAASDPQ
jgi:hypothetical protein